jgi:hypothetical protein
MSNLRVAVVGGGPVLAEVGARLRASALEIEVVDGPAPDVTVTSAPAPANSFLGVADHHHPNVYFGGGHEVPPRIVARYIVAAIEETVVAGAIEVRVRQPIQRSWAGYVAANGQGRKLVRKLKHFSPADFDYRSANNNEDVFDGAANIEYDGECIDCRIRVRGYFEPLDGHYHWAGIAFGEPVRALKDARATDVLIAVDGRDTVPARLAETTPWGTVRITGVGQPPYRLDDVEVLTRL